METATSPNFQNCCHLDSRTDMAIMPIEGMFVSAIILKLRYPRIEGAFHLPGGNWFYMLVCVIGLFGCVVALTVGFFAPAGIDVGGQAKYSALFAGGLVTMIAPVSFFYAYRYFYRKS